MTVLLSLLPLFFLMGTVKLLPPGHKKAEALPAGAIICHDCICCCTTTAPTWGQSCRRRPPLAVQSHERLDALAVTFSQLAHPAPNAHIALNCGDGNDKACEEYYPRQTAFLDHLIGDSMSNG